jgi:hypothetical protein
MARLTKTELNTLTDAGLLEALRRALSRDTSPKGTARTTQPRDLESELVEAVRVVLVEES